MLLWLPDLCASIGPLMEALTISSVTTRVKNRVAAFAVLGHGGPLFKPVCVFNDVTASKPALRTEVFPA